MMDKAGKKRIFFYGDSNTYGFDPADFAKGRYPETERWTGILKRTLAEEWEIDVNGLNGRRLPDLTWEETRIDQILYRLHDGEIFAVMLGTNDIKKKFGYCAIDIADEMNLLLEKVVAFNNFRQEGKAKIVLMSPPLFGKKPDSIYADPCYDYEEARKITKELAELYKQLADKFSCDYINAALYANADDSIDGYHLSGKEQTKLGLAIADIIKKDFTI